MNDPSRKQPRRNAFTLIEVLVVIAILAILLGILLPVIGKVRMAGYDSATIHRMQALMTAIDNYHQTNGAYPGPLSDAEIYSASNASGKAVKGANTGNLPAGLTSTENLTLALLGGATVDVSTGKLVINYDPAKVGVGPQSMNVLTQKLYAPYADPKACGLEQQSAGSAWVPWSSGAHATQVAHASLYADTAVPEFTDSFPDPLPFIYMRAQSAGNLARTMTGAPTPPGLPLNSTSPAIIWDPSQLQPYLFPAPSGNSAATISNNGYGNSPDAAVLADYPTPHYYFTLQTDHVTPIQPGGYLLIVAGKDRKFMTRDDRVNGSPVQ